MGLQPAGRRLSLQTLQCKRLVNNTSLAPVPYGQPALSRVQTMFSDLPLMVFHAWLIARENHQVPRALFGPSGPPPHVRGSRIARLACDGRLPITLAGMESRPVSGSLR